MAKTKSNSGNGLNAGELGTELPAENFPADQMTATAPEETVTQSIPEQAKTKVKMKTLVSGAEFWKFDDERDDKGNVTAKKDGEVFEGYFVSQQKREKDGKGDDQKAGSVIGYVFEQAETGDRYLIGKSHSIEKALISAEFVTDKLMRFVFLGKGKNSDGKPFNRFEISIEE